MTVPLVGMIICGMGLVGFAIWYFAAPRPLVVTDSAPSAPVERVFTPRTVHELLALYEGRTKAQGDVLMKPHIGLWLTFEGMLVWVGTEDDGTIAQVADAGARISCRFNHSWDVYMLRLNEGDTIRVNGRIVAGQGPREIHLQDCEIIDDKRQG